MELSVDASRMTDSSSPITVWESRKINAMRRSPMFLYLQQTIDEMGKRSKMAQGLNAALTSVQRLHDNPSHRLYLLCLGKLCIGILKVGVKKLFMRGKNGQLSEIEPLCVLDFYVHEAAQRSGHGKTLFETMLTAERIDPSKIGYDRPSTKFLSFLRKHYGLSDYVPQSNNFVVFSQYFEGSKNGDSSPSPHSKSGSAAADIGIGSIYGGYGEGSRVSKRVSGQELHSTHSSPFPTGGQMFPQVGRGGSTDRQGVSSSMQPSRPSPIPRSSDSGPTLNSAPTMGLSSSTYAGRGAPAANSTELARLQKLQRPMAPSSNANVRNFSTPSNNSCAPALSSSASNIRLRSPTRSSATYNILSHTEAGSTKTAGVAADRPNARRSHRPW